MLYLIAAIIFSFLCGGCTVALAILYMIYKFRDDLFVLSENQQVKYQRNNLSTLLHNNLHDGAGASALGEKESCRFVNVLFAFIFREWRDTNQFQKWVLKKVNIEFMEFMETKAASRLLEGLKVHDVDLGTNVPVFHSAKIKEPFSFTNDELPETVLLELDMEYHGGFFLAIDVDLVFGKTAFLAVRVTYLKGRVRLHFGRQPCTHWSISFVEEPEVKFDVKTSFETRQLPQLTSLIVNQIRRIIRRKHTFPHYKMRYNPLFSFQHPEPSPFDGFIGEIPIQPAVLEVCVAAATRLLVSPKGEKERNADSPNYVIFATVSVNVKSCVGMPLLNQISMPFVAGKPEIPEARTQPLDVPSTSKGTQVNPSKSQATPLDSIQRSILGRRKDAGLDSGKKSQQTLSVPSKVDPHPIEDENEAITRDRKDSVASTSSSSPGPSYVMVALNFGATLREETREDERKVVIVENITEHNEHGRSGMKDGDTVVELNGVVITSLSQAITTIERIRANKESFKFKVKRNRPDPDLTSLTQNGNAGDSDKSNTSFDTESDHSDIDLEDFKDFVNISLQVAEYHRKEGASKHRTSSMTGAADRPQEDLTRPHSSSLTDDTNADAPYMTLVSSLTPTTSLLSLKETAAGDKLEAGTAENKPQKRVEKETVRKKIDVNKIISPRSRSESPPFFRKPSPLPKHSTPLKSTHNASGKGDNMKTDTTRKREPSPVQTVRGNNAAREKADPSRPAKPEGERSTTHSENLSYARVDDDLDSQLYKTSLVNSNQREYSWNNEKFLFYLKERHRYLNIRYWAQQIGRQGILKTKPPQVIACVSVPLCELEMNCRGVSSRRVTRRFPLFAPNELPHDHKWFLNDVVSNRSSFREQYCYGDTILTLKLVPNPVNRNNSSNYRNIVDAAGTYHPNDETNDMITKEMLSKLSRKTGSDYLLTAATPKGRKLLVSRETQTSSKNTSTPKKTLKNESGAGDQPSTSNLEPKEETIKSQDKISLTQLLKGLIPGGKFVQDQKTVIATDPPSVLDDLSTESKPDDVIVGVITNRKSGTHQFEPVKFSKSTKCLHCSNKLWTKSGLQCIICNAICHNRCVEKFKKDQLCSEPSKNEGSPGNREKMDGFVVLNTDTDDNASDSDGLPTAALSFRNKILDMTSSSQPGDEVTKKSPIHKKFPLSKNSEDLLAVNAKEMGKDLHRDLPIVERKKMLDGQTQKVENELHSEITEKERLLEEQKLHERLSSVWKRFDRKITKSDERLQALALLLLHYRAGLEDCDFETTEEGMNLSDDESDKFDHVSSKSVPEVMENLEFSSPHDVTRDEKT